MEMAKRQIGSFSAIYTKCRVLLFYKCFTLEHVLSFNGILIHERCFIYTIASSYEVLLGFEPRPY